MIVINFRATKWVVTEAKLRWLRYRGPKLSTFHFIEIQICRCQFWWTPHLENSKAKRTEQQFNTIGLHQLAPFPYTKPKIRIESVRPKQHKNTSRTKIITFAKYTPFRKSKRNNNGVHKNLGAYNQSEFNQTYQHETTCKSWKIPSEKWYFAIFWLKEGLSCTVTASSLHQTSVSKRIPTCIIALAPSSLAASVGSHSVTCAPYSLAASFLACTVFEGQTT